MLMKLTTGDFLAKGYWRKLLMKLTPKMLQFISIVAELQLGIKIKF